jgi:hypothetical protein
MMNTQFRGLRQLSLATRAIVSVSVSDFADRLQARTSRRRPGRARQLHLSIAVLNSAHVTWRTSRPGPDIDNGSTQKVLCTGVGQLAVLRWLTASLQYLYAQIKQCSAELTAWRRLRREPVTRLFAAF